MRSSLVVRASDCQCTSCNGPGFDLGIRRHSGIWGEADEAVLNIFRKKKKKSPPKKKNSGISVEKFGCVLTFAVFINHRVYLTLILCMPFSQISATSFEDFSQTSVPNAEYHNIFTCFYLGFNVIWVLQFLNIHWNKLNFSEKQQLERMSRFL